MNGISNGGGHPKRYGTDALSPPKLPGGPGTPVSSLCPCLDRIACSPRGRALLTAPPLLLQSVSFAAYDDTRARPPVLRGNAWKVWLVCGDCFLIGEHPPATRALPEPLSVSPARCHPHADMAPHRTPSPSPQVWPPCWCTWPKTPTASSPSAQSASISW